MALNKTILKKVREKTEKEPVIGDFIVSLLEFESETPGRWKQSYNDILDNSCKEVKKGENN